MVFVAMFAIGWAVSMHFAYKRMERIARRSMQLTNEALAQRDDAVRRLTSLTPVQR